MDASPDETPAVGGGAGLDLPILAAALRYAEHGIAVFPARLYVRGTGKKGVRPIEDWDAASTIDPQVIRTWFEGAWSDAALCIDCGKSGLVGIDQDVTDGYDGVSAWEALNIGGPVTWRVRSPTGGRHDYYRADPAHPFTVDNTGAVAPGVDVRGMGGFLFAPPSIDPRGGAWQWIEGEPDWAGLPMVPEVVVKRMENRAADRRPKVPDRIDPAHAQAVDLSGSRSGSQLFGGSDFGPAGGYKTETSARALLSARLAEFASRTTEGNARSHFLAQDLGVLAGHGVGVFWTYGDALATLLDTARGNGMVTAHGLAYVTDQARRGLEYGMRQPWVRQAEAGFVQGGGSGAGGGESSAEDPVAAMLARMLTADQMAEMPAPVPLVKGLLDLDSLSWIIGEPGSFKSFVSLDLAAHVSSGRAWHGRPVTRGPVVYVAAEGTRGMGKRIRAWRKKYGDMGDVRFLPLPVKVTDHLSWYALVEACRRIEPVLVVIDTQARVTAGVEENSQKDMSTVIESFDAIKAATGACVLIVHHLGRNGTHARGSSAIDGAQDTELRLTRQQPRSAMVVKMTEDKQKDMAESTEGIVLRMIEEMLSEPGDPDPLTSLRVADMWEALEGGAEPEEIDLEPWRGRQPEPWTARVVAPQAKVQRRVLQVLRDHGRDRGLTSSAVRKVVTDRWERVSETGWNDAWTAVLRLDCVLNCGGERFTIDPVGLIEESDKGDILK